MKFLQAYREEITAIITNQLSEVKHPHMNISLSVKEKLLPYTISGKYIRGSLVCGVHDFYKGEKKQEAVEAAAAIELIQSTLLIIDDIIDKDTIRRGLITIHKDFEEEIKNPHDARSLAMCLALVSNFQAISLLQNQPKEIFDLIGYQLTLTGFGEMQEVVYTNSQQATLKEVMAVYENKTATYTFSLPMVVGAILADAPKEEVTKIHNLGKHLGLLFQIRDDMIDDLGPQVTGKSSSDEENNTQTIMSLVGEEKVKEMIEEQKTLAKDIISTMRVQKPFLEMIEYILTRTK